MDRRGRGGGHGRPGAEPLSSFFTAESLWERLSRRVAPIKALLLDQGLVAGIGDIYADEVLFLAGMHPLMSGRDLTHEDVTRLHKATVSRLREATRGLVPLVVEGGPPTEGEQGRALLLVRRKEGEPCRRCGTPIESVLARGRSSYFCLRHQAHS